MLGPAPTPAADAASPEEDGPEENIYEVMKQHMRRKQEELDAKTAQQKLQRASGGPPVYGRPGPNVPAPTVQRTAAVEKANDLTNLPQVWQAARTYLAQNARMLESVLGTCTRLHALTISPPEVTLQIPRTQQNFTNDKARAKLEEALRAVTDLPLKLRVDFTEPSANQPGAPGPHGATPNAPLQTAQRIPPELLEAVKKQPIIQSLMKHLDATITTIEMLDTNDPD